MVVYGDLLFAENFIIGCVIFYITGEIFNVKLDGALPKLRIAAGGILCGAFSMVIFLPVRTPFTVLMEIAFAFTACFAVFGKEKLWQKAAVFVLVTYFFGGITMGLLFVTKNPGIYTASGVYTGDMKAGYLAIFTALGLITAKQVIKTVSRKKFFEEHVFNVKISVSGVILETKGFLDSGNQLTDPVSGKAVAVAQESLWTGFEKSGILLPERMGVIPYGGIDGGGLMISVRTDYVEIGQRRMKGVVIAKGTGKFDIDGKSAADCELLLSKYMAGRRI